MYNPAMEIRINVPIISAEYEDPVAFTTYCPVWEDRN